MSRKISRKTKILRHMGEGTGKDYLPYITTSEFNSLGTTSVIKDWKTGRGVHCLSQGEALWYYILRWDDNNVDIREQYPLDRDTAIKIAEENGFQYPKQKNHIMTTDFLTTEKSGKLHAYSIKTDTNLNERTLQLLCIEKLYWNKQGVPYTLLYKVDVNKILVSNIRIVTEFYDSDRVFDGISAIKHKIATKEIKTDLETKILTSDDYMRLMKEEI